MDVVVILVLLHRYYGMLKLILFAILISGLIGLNVISKAWGAAILPLAAVFMAKSVKKGVGFCQFQFEVYNWQYFILHWQNYTVIITVHCRFHICKFDIKL